MKVREGVEHRTIASESNALTTRPGMGDGKKPPEKNGFFSGFLPAEDFFGKKTGKNPPYNFRILRLFTSVFHQKFKTRV